MSYANYDDVVNQLRAAGLDLSKQYCPARGRFNDLLHIGDRVRCPVNGKDKERRAWYHLGELRKDNGELLIIGGFGIFRGAGHDRFKIELHDEAKKLSDAEKKALAERYKQQQKAAEAAEKQRIEAVANKAQIYFRSSATEGSSEYLIAKQVGNHGGRFHRRTGDLVIPLADENGKIYGLQIIGPAVKKKYKTRNKTFAPFGFGKTGNFHMLGVPGDTILVAEGYATAASAFEATGICSVMAIDAGNLPTIVAKLRKRYKTAKILILADDDYVHNCAACGEKTLVTSEACEKCGQPHKKSNAGVQKAQEAALSTSECAFLTPVFSADRNYAKITDFNDLHLFEGLNRVRAQIEEKLQALGWAQKPTAAQEPSQRGAGVKRTVLKPIISVDEAAERFTMITGVAKTLFDHELNQLVPHSCMLDVMSADWKDYKFHPRKRIVRLDQVGFDPTGKDERIQCNMYSGWPTIPKSGSCEVLKELAEFLVNGEPVENLFKWLAYPIQNPGTKMKTAVVFHGPQGVGKNLFAEAVMRIYGDYGYIIDQAALEDKFNDWASKRLFIIADEAIARLEQYHIKNRLKGYITGDNIRINPKNMIAYAERNHMNFMVLSNEQMPVVLEMDDRRWWVYKTPQKLSPAFYTEVVEEINNGGIAAFHHFLLHLPLGDFKPWTLPSMTTAKKELVELSMDSTMKFYMAWINGEIEGIPLIPATSTDLWELYRRWCPTIGHYKHANQSIFANNLASRSDIEPSTTSERYTINGVTKKARFLYPLNGEKFDITKNKADWLGHCIERFRAGIGAWKRSAPVYNEDEEYA